MSGTPLAPDDVVRSFPDVVPGAREPLVVVDAVLRTLDAAGIGTGTDVDVRPIGDGHSNVTLLLERGGSQVVLRRPPRGPFQASAHDVVREARIIDALASRVRVPKVLAVEEDPDEIGAPYYVMELIGGHAIANALPPELDTPELHRRISEELVDALVELHRVDWRAAGLDRFGRPDGYLERQISRFTGLWDRQATREVPEVYAIADWLSANLPESLPSTVVHGDFRLGNVLIDDSGRVTSILDWEMATIGDPLADLGYLCALWVDQDDPPRGPFEFGGVTRGSGFLRRDELIARYEAGSGRSMDDPRWYEVLALWKMMVFMEGNYRRSAAGLSDDPWLASMEQGVLDLAARAEKLTRG